MSAPTTSCSRIVVSGEKTIATPKIGISIRTSFAFRVGMTFDSAEEPPGTTYASS